MKTTLAIVLNAYGTLRVTRHHNRLCVFTENKDSVTVSIRPLGPIGTVVLHGDPLKCHKKMQSATVDFAPGVAALAKSTKKMKKTLSDVRQVPPPGNSTKHTRRLRFWPIRSIM